ncbi:hypothetical protein PIB30_014734 [Stylosanthes scabra]|uniref:Uncharacterized protein n=1 Tax=Stylosanthes scabra TaxID=79078 RepID=A0ABU6X4A0_9FABA|nr:hypothetical protein [Stylosanthes scabra]
MMKLGWGLIEKKDTSWAKVIRAKYKCGNDTILNVQRRRNSSNLWKGISNSWKNVQENIIWRVGEGVMQFGRGSSFEAFSFTLSQFKKKVSQGCNQVKIPSTRLGSFSLGSRNKRLDELSLRRNKPPQDGGINPCPHILGIHNCEDTDLMMDSSKPRVTWINSPAVQARWETADNT